MTAPVLPPTGAVLGVDVGMSPTRRSSAACRLEWTEQGVSWTIQRFRAVPAEQDEVLRAVAGDAVLLAAAFDGPLRRGLDVIGRYRTAERMLTRQLGARIGKPGQSSAPVGKALNAAANACATVVRDRCRLAPAAHATPIDARAIAEAFPGAFMGVLLADPEAIGAKRSDRSDLFFRHLAASGGLDGVVRHLLPGRILATALDTVTNRDDRAALVCAITALCVAAGAFTAVGDATDGWIVLPPRVLLRPWALALLESNAREEAPGCLHLG